MNQLWSIVYKITNLLNEMYYIGKHNTTTPFNMKNYWGSNEWLKSSIKKHGKKNFKRETLFVFETEDEALAKEAELMPIELVNSGKVYNLKAGGDGGLICSEDTKKLIREKNSGETHPFYGKHHTKDTKKLMSEKQSGEKHYNYGKHLSESHKRKLSENLSGKNNPNYGKYHSEVTKKLMSKNSARKLTSEIVEQRREDVKNIEKVWGWKTRLSEKWGISRAAAIKFINKYALDLMQKWILDNTNKM